MTATDAGLLAAWVLVALVGLFAGLIVVGVLRRASRRSR